MIMAKKKTTTYQKLFFMAPPPGYAYHAGQVEEVPEELAESFIDKGYAREPKKTLPKDMPRREDLIAAGLETIQAVKNATDLTKVKNIGKAGEKEIAEYLQK